MIYVKKIPQNPEKGKLLILISTCSEYSAVSLKRKLQVYTNNEQYETGTNKTMP